MAKNKPRVRVYVPCLDITVKAKKISQKTLAIKKNKLPYQDIPVVVDKHGFRYGQFSIEPNFCIYRQVPQQ